MTQYYLLFSKSTDWYWKLLLGDYAHVSVLVVPIKGKPYIDGANWSNRYHVPVPVRNNTITLSNFTSVVKLPYWIRPNKVGKPSVSLFNCLTYVNKIFGLRAWTPRGLYKQFESRKIHYTHKLQNGAKEWLIPVN